MSDAMPHGGGVMLAKDCYDAYVAAAGGKSLVSGQPLPAWDGLPEKIQHAWTCAAAFVAGKVAGHHDWQEPIKEQAISRLKFALAAKDAEIAKLKSELDDAKFVARDIFEDWSRGDSFAGEDSHEAVLAWYYEQWPYLRGGEG